MTKPQFMLIEGDFAVGSYLLLGAFMHGGTLDRRHVIWSALWLLLAWRLSGRFNGSSGGVWCYWLCLGCDPKSSCNVSLWRRALALLFFRGLIVRFYLYNIFQLDPRW